MYPKLLIGFKIYVCTVHGIEMLLLMIYVSLSYQGTQVTYTSPKIINLYVYISIGGLPRESKEPDEYEDDFDRSCYEEKGDTMSQVSHTLHLDSLQRHIFQRYP